MKNHLATRAQNAIRFKRHSLIANPALFTGNLHQHRHE